MVSFIHSFIHFHFFSIFTSFINFNFNCLKNNNAIISNRFKVRIPRSNSIRNESDNPVKPAKPVKLSQAKASHACHRLVRTVSAFAFSSSLASALIPHVRLRSLDMLRSLSWGGIAKQMARSDRAGAAALRWRRREGREGKDQAETS